MTVLHIVEGVGAPATAPPSKAAHYLNTTTGELYIAKGTASAADWVLLAEAVATAQALAAHVASATPHATLGGVDSLTFDTTAGIVVGPGQMAWNATDATVDIGLPGGVTLQGGQEFLIRVLNNTGATLTNLTAVYITGAQGNRTTVAKAAGASFSADKTVAILTQDILNNQEGFATVTGLVRNVDTTAFAEGGEVWLSATTPGAITPTKPAAPNNAVLLGYCVRSNATVGSIYVSVRGLGALARATDVTITSPISGQTLTYNGTVWVNQTPASPVITESGAARVSALIDAGSYIRFTNTGAKTYTIQPQASVAWVANTEIRGRNAAATNLTLTPGSGVTLNAPYAGTLQVPPSGWFMLKRVASNVWDVSGQTV